MSRKKILVTGCGGAPSNSFIRSLKKFPGEYEIYGIDCNKYTIHRSLADTTFICPHADSPDYLNYLITLIQKYKIQFIHAQPECEVKVLSENRELIEATGCKTFLPSKESIDVLTDKYKSYNIWKQCKQLTVPKNIIIKNEADLRLAYNMFKKIWLRDTSGAAGRGSLSNPEYDLAKSFLSSRNAWGHTVAAEHLTDRTVTWQSIWKDGELIVGQGRERLYWEMSNRTQSGVTGVTGTGLTVSDPSIDEIAINAILAIDNKPHGIFSVDMTYDCDGVPNPTEINIGKFFTTHYFLTCAGCNMPDIYTQLAFDEYRGNKNIKNPCKPGMLWIRGMDAEPLMIHESEIDNKVKERGLI